MRSLSGNPELDAAMWAGDTEKLHKLAPCRCCCYEHTFTSCPARAWGGCRGQGNDPENADKWAEHYQKFHGMAEDDFFGVTPSE